jgi:PAS domain S-box-containing protein
VARAGLRGAFAFPIRSKGGVLGVIELFSPKILPPDEDLLQTVATVGNQFGQFIERKRAQEELHHSEYRLRLAVESTTVGTWDFNPITGELAWDDRYKAMFGLSPEAEVDYEVFLARLHPEDRDRTYEVVRRSLDPASEGRYDIEYRTVGLENGIERWVAARGQAFFDDAGRTVRFIGTVLDITESRRAEEETRTRATRGECAC